MKEHQVESLRLPLSGLLYQFRPDGRWRCLTQAQLEDEAVGRFTPRHGDWSLPEPTDEVGGKAQWSPGQHDDEEAWWLTYGVRGPVTVKLADGRLPPVIEFGPLWICEWVGRTQPAVVTVGGRDFTFFDGVPGCRGA